MRAYIDADWVGNIDDRKRTSGGAFFLGKRLVTWTIKKQNCTSQLTAKAKYVAAAISCTNIIWIKLLLKGMKEEIIELMILHCDNKSAINISKNLVIHTKTKYISIMYHYLRELVQDKKSKDGICEYKRTDSWYIHKIFT